LKKLYRNELNSFIKIIPPKTSPKCDNLIPDGLIMDNINYKTNILNVPYLAYSYFYKQSYQHTWSNQFEKEFDFFLFIELLINQMVSGQRITAINPS